MKKGSIILLLSAYLVTSSGCGVLLYPERQGQEGGKIDPVVAILDGIGLLLYVIPGLVAFAIDFHQGTIYLPGGGIGSIDDMGENGKTLKIEGEMTQEAIEKAIREATGKEINIEDATVQVYDLKHPFGREAAQTAYNQFSRTTKML